MSDKPVMHGRDHRTGGMDPIGIIQVPYASLRTNSPSHITVPGDDAVHYLSMEDGGSGAFETSYPDIFSNSQNTHETGSPWSIECSANGTYIVHENYLVAGGTAGVQITTYHTIYGGAFTSNFQPGRTAALIGDAWDAGSSDVHLFFTEWTDATDASPGPIFISPYATLASGADASVEVQTMVIYLGPYAGGNI